MAILRAEKLQKQYRHADGLVKALDGVTLDIEEGSFLTITGPSGSGKSTLLLTLGGLMRPTAGGVYFHDDALHLKSEGELAAFRRDHLGFVMQNFSLIPYLTALQNVMIPLALQGGDAREQQAKATEILESVDLVERRSHLPRELSIGQQQRVAIARAFANDPEVILADEPTGNLDPSLSEDILDLLADLNQTKGTTVVMVTHSPEAARRGSVRVHLDAGRLAEHEAVA